MIARTVATLTFATLSLSAFAQFGTWGHNNDTRTWHPPGVVVNQQGGSFVSGAPIASSAILAAQPVVARGVPANCQVIEKTTWQRINGGAGEAVIKGIGLGLLGAAADRIGRTGGRWTEVGLIGGAGVGFLEGSADKYTMVCHNSSNQPSGTASNSSQGTGGYMCAIEGLKETLLVKDPSTCPQIAGNMAKAKVVSAEASVQQAPTPTQHGPVRADPPKPWGHRGATGTCYFTQELKGSLPTGCAQATTVAATDGEGMSAWKARLP